MALVQYDLKTLSSPNLTLGIKKAKNFMLIPTPLRKMRTIADKKVIDIEV